jgi:hypothetical protein
MTSPKEQKSFRTHCFQCGEKKELKSIKGKIMAYKDADLPFPSDVEFMCCIKCGEFSVSSKDCILLDQHLEPAYQKWKEEQKPESAARMWHLSGIMWDDNGRPGFDGILRTKIEGPKVLIGEDIKVIEYSAYQKLQEELSELKSYLPKVPTEPYEKRMAREIAELQAKLADYEKALEKIANYDTLDGDKYNNYTDGWYGVAKFAKEALAKVRNDSKEGL